VASVDGSMDTRNAAGEGLRAACNGRNARPMHCPASAATCSRVSCTLNMLMWRYINEDRDDKSFMGVERVSSP
jgi:hypothetical protein